MLVASKRAEDDHVVDPVDELRGKVAPDLAVHDLPDLGGVDRLPGPPGEAQATLGDQAAAAEVGGHDDDGVREVHHDCRSCRSDARPRAPAAGGCRCRGGPSRSRRGGHRVGVAAAPAPTAAPPPRSRRTPGASRSAATRCASPCTRTCRSGPVGLASWNRNAASWRATSVLPTPDGPRKMNEPIGRSGLVTPSRLRRIARATARIASYCPTTRWDRISSIRRSRSASSSSSERDRDAGPRRRPRPRRRPGPPPSTRPARLPGVAARAASSSRRLSSSSRSSTARSKSLREIASFICATTRRMSAWIRRRHRGRADPPQLHPGSGLVDHVDRLVREEPIGDVPARVSDRRRERLVGVTDAVELLVAAAHPLQDGRWSRPRSAGGPAPAGSAGTAPGPFRRTAGTPSPSSRRCR